MPPLMSLHVGVLCKSRRILSLSGPFLPTTLPSIVAPSPGLMVMYLALGQPGDPGSKRVHCEGEL